MKRCPSCHRTYVDDTMTNCAHDGAPLMAAAYSPQGPPMIPPPQPYAPRPVEKVAGAKFVKKRPPRPAG